MGHVTRKENYRNLKINIVDNPRNRRTRSKIDGKEPIAGRDRARGSESERLGWLQVSRFPQGFGLHTAKGISGTLLPTALNNFKAHFPPLKRISCARRRQGTARGRRGKRRGEAVRHLTWGSTSKPPTPW